MQTGSISPVGRITCSAKTPPVRSSSHGPGVAETKMVCGRIASHSSNLSGRLSTQDGSRKPNSDSVDLRLKSPRNMPPTCGTVTCDFVDDQERVVRQILEQRRRRLAGVAAGQEARVVLDARAGAGCLDHLDIEGRALLQPLRLQQLVLPVQLVEPPLELFLDTFDRLGQRRLRRDVVAVGVDA